MSNQQQQSSFQTQIAMQGGGGHGADSSEVYAALNNIANGLDAGVFPKLEAAGLLQGLEALTIFGPVNAGGLSFLVDALKKGIELDSSMHHGDDGSGGAVPDHGEGHGDNNPDNHDRNAHHGQHNNSEHHGQEGAHHAGHGQHGQHDDGNHNGGAGGGHNQHDQKNQEYIGGNVDPSRTVDQLDSQKQKSVDGSSSSWSTEAASQGGVIGGGSHGGLADDGIERGQFSDYMQNLSARIKNLTSQIDNTGRFDPSGKYTPNQPDPNEARNLKPVFAETAGSLNGAELQPADPTQAQIPGQSPAFERPQRGQKSK
jgi:hypothetical protein